MCSCLFALSARSANTNNVFVVGNFGGVDSDIADGIYGVAPVFYLSSDITLSESGTDIDPYEIVL